MTKKTFTMVGENSDIDNVKETLWSKGGVYAPLSAAEICKVVSDDDEDGGGGVITETEDYSGTVAGTIKCTCASHGLETADTVVLVGKYAGTYPVTVLDANTFYISAVWDGDDTTIPWVRAEVVGDITAFADYSGTEAGTVKATCVGHGLVEGDTVIHTGTINFDGTFTAHVIDANNYYFTAVWAEQTVAWVRAAGGANIQDFEDAGGGEVQANSVAHGLKDGMTTTIASPQFNGSYVVSVSDPDYFTFTEVFARETGAYVSTNHSGNITGTADAGSGKVRVFTEDPHGLVDGQEVIQAGTTSYNGTYTIEYEDENQYLITETYVANETGTFNDAEVSDSFTAFDDYNSTVPGTTKCTKTSHGLVDGQEFTLSSSTNYNGVHVAHVIDANTLYIDVAFVPESGTHAYAEKTGTFSKVEDYSGTVLGTVKGTDTAHGLVSGEIITATSSEGDYDGSKTVTVLTANTLYWTDDYVPETGSFSSPELSGTFTEIADGGGGEIDCTDEDHGLLDNHLITLTSTKYADSPYTVIKNSADVVAITETWDGDDTTIAYDYVVSVTIPYLTANLVLKSEEVELDGTTAVPMSAAAKYILAPYISEGVATGNITVTNNAGNVNLAYIVAGDTAAKHPIFVVPQTYVGVLESLELDVKTDDTVIFTLEANIDSLGNLTEGIFHELGSYEVDGIGTRSIDLDGMELPEGTVITVKAVSTAAESSASASFSLQGYYHKN